VELTPQALADGTVVTAGILRVEGDELGETLSVITV